MKYGIQEIDHVVSVVRDSEDAGRRLSNIGFTVTPLSIMGSVGLANRLVLFSPQSSGVANFIELMGIVDEGKIPPSLRPYVRGKKGFHWIVLSGPSAAAVFEQLNHGGYAAPTPMRIERDWCLASGEVLHLAFNVMMPIEAPIPFNFCEYRTLQHYVRPEFLTHANGAETLTGILCQSEQPDECLNYFEALFGNARRPLGNDLCVVTPNRVDLIVGSPSAWERVFGRRLAAAQDSPHRLIGCRIKVRNLSETRSYLRDKGLTPDHSAVGLLLDSPLGDDTWLAFHA